MKILFITGVSRGLGLGLAKKYLEMGSKVVGTFRQTTSELQEIQNNFRDNFQLVHWEAGMPLDIRQLNRFPEDYWPNKEKCFDVIINNVGYKPPDPDSFPYDLQGKDLLDAVSINVVGPLEIAKALVPQWTHEGTKMVNLSTSIASLAQTIPGYATAYAASKTTLNMVSLHLKPWLEKHGISLLLLHPGWVKTDMGGDRAPLSIEESVQGMVKVIAEQGVTSPMFLDYLGNALPW